MQTPRWQILVPLQALTCKPAGLHGSAFNNLDLLPRGAVVLEIGNYKVNPAGASRGASCPGRLQTGSTPISGMVLRTESGDIALPSHRCFLTFCRIPIPSGSEDTCRPCLPACHCPTALPVQLAQYEVYYRGRAQALGLVYLPWQNTCLHCSVLHYHILSNKASAVNSGGPVRSCRIFCPQQAVLPTSRHRS